MGSPGRASSGYRAICNGVATVPSVSVVIPAKNEASNLAHVFRTIPEWVDEIVLVDCHSVDGIAAASRKPYPDVQMVQSAWLWQGGYPPSGIRGRHDRVPRHDGHRRYDQRSSAQRARPQRRWMPSDRDHAVATRGETSSLERVAAESWS